MATALGESLGTPFTWAVGFFFADIELSLELWTIIAGISGFVVNNNGYMEQILLQKMPLRGFC